MKTKEIHRGILSIELAISLAVVMFVSILGLTRYRQHIDEVEWTVQARQMYAVTTAAKSYIRDNRNTLVSQVSGGGTVRLTGAQLQQAGYLPDGFQLSNMATQTFEVAIVRNPKATQKLMAFVLTRGGTPFTYKGMRYISHGMEGTGGYIQNTNQAEGAYGSWKFNLATYGLTGEAGRLVTYLSSEILGTDDQESDRLYRYAITSRPELNRMHAAIDMNGHNLNNAGTVKAVTGTFSGNVSARDGVFTGNVSGQSGGFSSSLSAPNVTATNLNTQTTRTSGETYTGGWYRSTGDTGWYNEKHAGGFYMSDSQWIRSYADKGIYTGGQVQAGSIQSKSSIVAAGTVQANGRMTANEFVQVNGVATAGASCSPNGLIGRDASGGILSCQSGVWKSSKSDMDSFVVIGASGCNKTYSYAACPAGNKLLSGGYSLTYFSGNASNAYNAPDGSFPDVANNRWVVTGAGSNNNCFAAYAMCSR